MTAEHVRRAILAVGVQRVLQGVATADERDRIYARLAELRAAGADVSEEERYLELGLALGVPDGPSIVERQLGLAAPARASLEGSLEDPASRRLQYDCVAALAWLGLVDEAAAALERFVVALGRLRPPPPPLPVELEILDEQLGLPVAVEARAAIERVARYGRSDQLIAAAVASTRRALGEPFGAWVAYWLQGQVEAEPPSALHSTRPAAAA